MTDRFYQVGKRVGTKLVPSFRITRLSNGGIRILDRDNIDSGEESLILTHFGRPLRGTTGVENEQHRRLFTPGTQEHFDQAVHVLPAPFSLMRKQK